MKTKNEKTRECTDIILDAVRAVGHVTAITDECHINRKYLRNGMFPRISFYCLTKLLIVVSTYKNREDFVSLGKTLFGKMYDLNDQYQDGYDRVCVIHQNRNADNRGLRGWLGTEMMNKAFEVFTCTKLKQKEGMRPVFCVEQSLTRKYDIDSPLFYQVDDEGVPTSADMVDVRLRNTQGKFTKKADSEEALNRYYIVEQPDDKDQPWRWNLEKLFSDAMGGWALRNSDDLEQRVMDLSHIRQKQYYYKVLNAAIKEGIIRHERDKYGRTVFSRSPS